RSPRTCLADLHIVLKTSYGRKKENKMGAETQKEQGKDKKSFNNITRLPVSSEVNIPDPPLHCTLSLQQG
ncbi:mCG140491, isoform CRA_a, partial [Mus musculus]